MNEIKIGAENDFWNELVKSVNIQDHLNSKIKNKDTIFKSLAHDVVYKLRNPGMHLPPDPIWNYYNHYVDKQMFEESPNIDPYDYQPKFPSNASPYPLRSNLDNWIN